MFDVERSMFDVLLSLDKVFSMIHCSGFLKFHMSFFGFKRKDKGKKRKVEDKGRRESHGKGNFR